MQQVYRVHSWKPLLFQHVSAEEVLSLCGYGASYIPQLTQHLYRLTGTSWTESSVRVAHRAALHKHFNSKTCDPSSKERERLIHCRSTTPKTEHLLKRTNIVRFKAMVWTVNSSPNFQKTETLWHSELIWFSWKMTKQTFSRYMHIKINILVCKCHFMLTADELFSVRYIQYIYLLKTNKVYIILVY